MTELKTCKSPKQVVKILKRENPQDNSQSSFKSSSSKTCDHSSQSESDKCEASTSSHSHSHTRRKYEKRTCYFCCLRGHILRDC